MELPLLVELQKIQVDTEGSLQRFAGNADLYVRFLLRFPSDGTFADLRSAFLDENWQNMLQAAHTLKGVAGNLGLNRLYRASAETVRLLRAQDTAGAKQSYQELETAYHEIYTVLDRFGAGES